MQKKIKMSIETLTDAFNQFMASDFNGHTSDAFLWEPDNGCPRMATICDVDDHDGVIFLMDQWDNEFEVEFELVDGKVKEKRIFS